MKRPTPEKVAREAVRELVESAAPAMCSFTVTATEVACATAMQRAMDEFYKPLVEAARMVVNAPPGPTWEYTDALAAALREVDDGDQRR